MLRLFEENPEFGQYTIYDTDSGVLKHIGEDDFKSLKGRHESFSGKNSKKRTNFPRRIYFQITRNCNLNCDYCFIKAKHDNNHLDKDVIFKIAEYLGKRGLMEVRLTGGEPTTHPYFKGIFEKFRKENIYVSVATNCVWNKSMLDYLSGLDGLWIIASIDGSRNVHNKFRNNSYDTVIRNLTKLRSRNTRLRLRLNTVLTKENVDDLEHLSLLTRDLDAESITLIPLRPQVRDNYVKEKMLSAFEFKEVLDKMVRYRELYGTNFTTTIETKYKDAIMKDKIFEKKSSCAAGREGTNLDFDNSSGKFMLYACSYCPASDLDEKRSIREPFLAGEFLYEDITQFGMIWEDDSNWTIFRDLSLKSEECKNCDELGKRCTGSCPIQNINLDGIPENKSIKDEIMAQMRKNAEWYCYKRLLSN